MNFTWLPVRQKMACVYEFGSLVGPKSHIKSAFNSARACPLLLLVIMQNIGKHLILMASFFAASTLSSTAFGMRCSMVFIEQNAAVKALVEYDAYTQWLKWESTANLIKYRKSTAEFSMPTLRVPLHELEIQKDPALPIEVLNIFSDGNTALWIKHPFNDAPEVPYVNAAATGEIPGFFTSSRSVGLAGNLRGYTIKTPTNRPHGLEGELQTGKAETKDDVLSALVHSEHIRARDAVIGEDPVLMILPEVLTIADKITGTGIVLRDIRQTDDGHYYLPALSIPYVGREIAKINGQPFEIFWEKHYASLLGQAKARLMMRYGLQMETPNPQNMLIQLDRNLRPTGRIAFRDVSDAMFVKGVAKSLGFADAVNKDVAIGYDVKPMKPFVSNSLWRLDEAGEKSVSPRAMVAWANAHNAAFTAYVVSELRVGRPELRLVDASDNMSALYHFLRTPEGVAILKTYAAKKSAAMKEAG